jgi:hypothetical protein
VSLVILSQNGVTLRFPDSVGGEDSPRRTFLRNRRLPRD